MPAVLKFIVRRLAEASKGRSGDYLICAAHDHSRFSGVRDACRRASLFERLQLLADLSQPLANRAVAAWFASGINGPGNFGQAPIGRPVPGEALVQHHDPMEFAFMLARQDGAGLDGRLPRGA
jgi:hypothetical protein